MMSMDASSWSLFIDDQQPAGEAEDKDNIDFWRENKNSDVKLSYRIELRDFLVKRLSGMILSEMSALRI